jgi:hypothetical protein
MEMILLLLLHATTTVTATATASAATTTAQTQCYHYHHCYHAATNHSYQYVWLMLPLQLATATISTSLKLLLSPSVIGNNTRDLAAGTTTSCHIHKHPSTYYLPDTHTTHNLLRLSLTTIQNCMIYMDMTWCLYSILVYSIM